MNQISSFEKQFKDVDALIKNLKQEMEQIKDPLNTNSTFVSKINRKIKDQQRALEKLTTELENIKNNNKVDPNFTNT